MTQEMGINKNKDPEENEEKQGMTYADRVQEKVRIAKLNSSLRREFMNWEMTLLVERNKGHDEGHAEGRSTLSDSVITVTLSGTSA